MSDEIIIQQLKDKELQLLNELNKVKMALRVFLNDSINTVAPASTEREVYVAGHYDKSLTYANKILYVLAASNKPMLVDEITAEIMLLEPELEINKLHKSVSHNVSMLAKYSRVKKHPFNRKIKYSIS